jgi:hypothetical protein
MTITTSSQTNIKLRRRRIKHKLGNLLDELATTQQQTSLMIHSSLAQPKQQLEDVVKSNG